MRKQRVFRIFVSSTFGDFQAEREALRDRVWPRLRDFCRARGGDFQAVDLRWGVSESAGLEHETMKICLDEIAHCQRLSPRPNFLVLVGDRYGWRPLPPALPPAEFEQILRHYAGVDGAGEVLGRWYRRDDNAVPADYVLQPRPADYADWAPVEARLVQLLRGAARALGMTPERRERYFLSATHLEIVRGALSDAVSDAEQHVLAFVRTLDGLPEGDGLAAARRFVDVTPEGTRDPDALAYLHELKAELRQRLAAEPGRVFEYRARWTGAGPAITTDHLDALCRDVETGLMRVMEEQLARLKILDPVDAERQAHEDFGRERGRVFVGREEPLAVIVEYLAGETTPALRATPPCQGGDQAILDSSPAKGECSKGSRGYPPLVLHGPGGSGKSALLAQAIQAAGVAHPDAVVAQRFIGASPASVGLRALLGGLCREIARAYDRPEALPEGDMKELIAAFSERLAYARAERPLLVFIDALDQLVSQDGVQPFEWLPTALPPHVRLLLSVLDGPDGTALRRRLPEARTLAVPPVTDQEAEAMLDALLAEATSTQPARHLTPAQRTVVLEAFKGVRQPLWLKLAVTLARRWRSYDQQTPDLSVPGTLVDRLLTRLQGEHGPVLVERALAYLLAARHGLTDDELLEVLWRDADAHAEFDRRKNPDQPAVNALPPIVWSRLYFDLEPYLIERAADGTACYAFFHRQLGEALRAAFLSAGQAPVRHAHLAAYFREQGWRGVDRRPQLRTLAELPWQQTQARQLNAAEATLTDFDFAMAKCEAGEQDDLIGDYGRTLVVMSPPSRAFKLWENFFRSRWHILRRADSDWPGYKILLQLAVEHADESPVTQAAERWLEQGHCDWVWLRNPQRVKEAGIDPCTVLLEGEKVEGVQLLPDGRLLSWGDKLRIWDLETERCVAVLEGHTESIKGVQMLADGCLLSWSYDKTLRLWDLTTGVCLSKLESPCYWKLPLEGCLLSYSNSRHDKRHFRYIPALSTGHVLTYLNKKTLQLIDLATGKVLSVFNGHKEPIRGVQLLSQNRLISYCRDSIRLWSFETGECLKVLNTWHTAGVQIIADNFLVSWTQKISVWNLGTGKKEIELVGHQFWVQGVRILSKNRLLSWSEDIENLRLWNLETGECLLNEDVAIEDVLVISNCRLALWRYDNPISIFDLVTGDCVAVLNGHKGQVRGMRVLPNKCLLSWTFDDGTLRLWDGLKGVCLAELKGHINSVMATQVLDGCLLSWGHGNDNKDFILELWDLTIAMCVVTLAGHTDSINGVQMLPNNHLLSWSSDKTLRLWNLVTGICMGMLAGHTGSIDGVEVLPDDCLLSWSSDKTLRLWNRVTGAYRAMLNDQGIIENVQVISKDLLLLWLSNNTIHLWNLATGTHLEMSGGYKDWGWEVLPESRLLSRSSDKILRLWDEMTGVCLGKLEGHEASIKGIKILPDGLLLSWSLDKILRLWDLSTGKCVKLEGHTASIQGSQVVSDRCLISWSTKGYNDQDIIIYFWDKTTGLCWSILETQTFGVKGVDIQPNGCIFSTRNTIFYLREFSGLWQTTLYKIKGVQIVSESCLLLWSWDNFLRLLNVVTGECLLEFEDKDQIVDVQILPDGNLLSWSEKSIRLWDLTTGRCRATLEENTGKIEKIQVLSNELLLSQLSDKTLRLWDLTTGTCKAMLTGYNIVRILANEYLLLRSSDGILWLWDLTIKNYGETAQPYAAPELLAQYEHAKNNGRLVRGNNVGWSRDKIAVISWLNTKFSSIAVWHSDSGIKKTEALSCNGILVISLDSNQFLCLNLYRGDQRIDLEELARVPST